MQTYIAILRGINVGGKKPMKMQALKQLCEKLGFENVQTYIQSGNVVFKYKKEKNKLLATMLSKNIVATFGFEVPVLILTLAEIKLIVNDNKFTKDKTKDITFLHVTFLEETPTEEQILNLQKNNFAPDEFLIQDKAVYLYCPNNYSNSKLTNTFLENKLKVTATTRNWKTVNELLSLATNLKIIT
jgi:uncharacterized protein (DUF1697 family)